MSWKDAPTEPGLMWLNKSMELQILLACNWHCIACDQGSQFGGFDFVKKGTMTMDQLGVFAGEMIENRAYLGRIRILGGEPTVHPKFQMMVEFLHHTLVPRHVGCIEVVTNGSHPERIARVAHLIRKARVSGERQKAAAHVANFLHTPESLGYRGTVCRAPWHCGFSLNFYGYFPCSSGAGIARFEDWMRWQRLALPTCKKPGSAVRENWPDLQDLCSHCYHGLKEKDKVMCGTSDPKRNAPGPHIAPKLDAWRQGKKAEWPVYGGPA